MIEQAVILAGGKGSRLGSLTADTPKPILEVGGAPFLGHLLWSLMRHGVRDVILSVGYRAGRIRQAIGEGTGHGVRIRYVEEREPLGTGGGLRLCLPHLDQRFLLLNGDTLFDINLVDLPLGLGDGQDMVMALREVPDVSRYGGVDRDGERVVGFFEKGREGRGVVNGGVCAVERRLIEELPEGPVSLESQVFPRLARAGRLKGRLYDRFFIDIGVAADLERARIDIPRWRRKAAVFFDRDGVLNADDGYVSTPEEFRWLPGAREAVKAVNDAGLLAIVVTNQAGIARGYYPVARLHELTAWMQGELAELGAHFDDLLFCPHHPQGTVAGLRRVCGCRKPEPGLLLEARRRWGIDLEASVLLGDKQSDLEAGRRAGVGRLVLVRAGQDILSQLGSAMPRSR